MADKKKPKPKPPQAKPSTQRSGGTGNTGDPDGNKRKK